MTATFFKKYIAFLFNRTPLTSSLKKCQDNRQPVSNNSMQRGVVTSFSEMRIFKVFGIFTGYFYGNHMFQMKFITVMHITGLFPKEGRYH